MSDIVDTPMFGLIGTSYVALRDVRYCDRVRVPKRFVFDGVSVPWFCMFLFSHDDLKRGVYAACLHDYMCVHKDRFKRREATEILVRAWKDSGLGSRWYTAWKPFLVFASVELYKWANGWK